MNKLQKKTNLDSNNVSLPPLKKVAATLKMDLRYTKDYYVFELLSPGTRGIILSTVKSRTFLLGTNKKAFKSNVSRKYVNRRHLSHIPRPDVRPGLLTELYYT